MNAQLGDWVKVTSVSGLGKKKIILKSVVEKRPGTGEKPSRVLEANGIERSKNRELSPALIV